MKQFAFLISPALAFLAACASPVPAPSAESYRALGQEPGWALAIGGGRIDYVGDYGETRINVPRPEPKPRPGGRRYEAPRLIVDITNGRCNDVMSGHGYSDRVTVIAEGKTVTGCGGQRRQDWDQ